MASTYKSPYKVDEEWYLAPPSAPCVPSQILNVQMRKRFPKVILSFSGGKDSIATYLALREAGYGAQDVIPFYMYWIPGLGFVERLLRHYEDTLLEGVHIERLPHPALYKLLNNLIFQPPERCDLIENYIRLPYINYEDLRQELVEDYHLDKDQFYTLGVRATDSQNRYGMLKEYGPLIEREWKWFAIWDWRLRKVTHEIERRGIKLAPDYKIFGRSFDGIDLRFLLPMKEHYPEDYKKVLDWFPLAELEIKRYEWRNRRY